jgi:hypothetical protein
VPACPTAGTISPIVSAIDDSTLHDNMFWSYGREILAAAAFVRDKPKLHIVYITNFKCGPDSCVKHFITEVSGRPFLTLQFDGHNNDAGMLTRCEAYLDSKGMLRRWGATETVAAARDAPGRRGAPPAPSRNAVVTASADRAGAPDRQHIPAHRSSDGRRVSIDRRTPGLPPRTGERPDRTPHLPHDSRRKSEVVAHRPWAVSDAAARRLSVFAVGVDVPEFMAPAQDVPREASL